MGDVTSRIALLQRCGSRRHRTCIGPRAYFTTALQEAIMQVIIMHMIDNDHVFIMLATGQSKRLQRCHIVLHQHSFL